LTDNGGYFSGRGNMTEISSITFFNDRVIFCCSDGRADDVGRSMRKSLKKV
jgi:hypothetical protein